MYEQATNSVFIEGTHSEKYFEPVRSYQELINNAVEYEADYLPPIWKDISAEAQAAGHGGHGLLCIPRLCRRDKKENRYAH